VTALDGSNGLLSRGSQVQLLPGAPIPTEFASFEPAKILIRLSRSRWWFHPWIPNALPIPPSRSSQLLNRLQTNRKIVRNDQYHGDDYEAVELSVLRHKE
jgi:hypothetical protein